MQTTDKEGRIGMIEDETIIIRQCQSGHKFLGHNQISDITPLMNLGKLRWLVYYPPTSWIDLGIPILENPALT